MTDLLGERGPQRRPVAGGSGKEWAIGCTVVDGEDGADHAGRRAIVLPARAKVFTFVDKKVQGFSMHPTRYIFGNELGLAT